MFCFTFLFSFLPIAWFSTEIDVICLYLQKLHPWQHVLQYNLSSVSIYFIFHPWFSIIHFIIPHYITSILFLLFIRGDLKIFDQFHCLNESFLENPQSQRPVGKPLKCSMPTAIKLINIYLNFIKKNHRHKNPRLIAFLHTHHQTYRTQYWIFF